MQFGTHNEFISWFLNEINKKIPAYNASGWIAPSTYHSIARQVLQKVASDIEIPNPYATGGWKDLRDFALKIWNLNYSRLGGKGYATSYGSNASYSSASGNPSGSSNNRSYHNNNNNQSGNSTPHSSYNSSFEVSDNGAGVVIKKHNFEKELRKIQNFADSVPSIPNLGGFETEGGLFGWGDHYINGYEMNRHTEELQNLFQSHNKVITDTIQEFREIYKTFDYLDKEYLQGIIQAVNSASAASKGAKIASDQATTASKQAKSAADLALKNEADLKKDVENLRKLVEKIKTIKEDLSSKIDQIEYSLNKKLTELREKIAFHTLSQEQKSLMTKLEKTLGKTKHIEDIDDLWDLVEIQEKTITNLRGKCEELELLCKETQTKLEQSKSTGNNYAAAPNNCLENKQNLIWAYVIGGAGLLVAICSLIF